uniref:Uncharacterized protein MANES_14G034100 n=2 Tax=Rhizophora mucronata TaxID=61149 RepID=A0A2P2KGM3_RHIMU
MAVLSFPRFPFCTHNSPPPRPPPCRRAFSAPATAGMAQTSGGQSAVLWFKQDLRLEDHPGLVQAAKSPALVPLYVFDHRILSHYSDEMLELVVFALDDLRKLLKGLRSNLMIRFGSSENVIRDVVQEVKAANVFAEEEAEYHLRKVMDIVEETLAQTPFLDCSPSIVQWQAPFYNIKNLKGLPTFYVDFKKLRLPVTSPVSVPNLSGVELELEWGSLPTLEEVKKFMNQSPFKLKGGWTLMDVSTATILQKKLLESRQVNSRDLTFKDTQIKSWYKSVFVTQKGNTVGGGTSSILNGLAAYLRDLEGTARNDWQEVHDRLCDTESWDGASFSSLFGPALWLGIISRRRLYYEAIKYEKERNAGFLSLFGYSTATVAAAADAVCSMEVP